MSIPAEYLKYPLRRYGMDHDRYDWSMLPRRKPVKWPNDAKVALWICPALEWFPLDMKGKPFKAPGGMVTAYPDLRHYTLRDYGNRVGIYRLAKAFARHGLKVSVAVNAAVAIRYPSLLRDCVQWGWEIIANGYDMDHLHYEGLTAADERKRVAVTLETLRQTTGTKIRGWLSPAKSESYATPDLLTEAGIEYVCDWVNDDMPFAMRTGSGALYAMPHPIDIDDYTILVQNRHAENEFRDQLIDQFDVLYKEADTQGGRIMAISLHPWITGQPYRIGALEQALAHIAGHRGVWSATGAEILDAWKGQQG